jgi:anti-anti-sigma factor
MEIAVDQINNIIKIICSGNIDNESVTSFAQTLEDVRKNKNFDKVVFDMKNVNCITSSGIARLIMFYKLMESTERTMEILVSDMLFKQFRDIHLHKIISISTSTPTENSGLTICE